MSDPASDLALPAAQSAGLERVSIRREIIRLAWPVVLQSLLRTMMFLVDTYMLGHYGGAEQSRHALAAVALVGPVAHTLVMILAALGTGALATVARATGARDPRLQEQEGASAVALAAGGGLLLLCVAIPFYPMLGRVFRVPDNPGVAEAGAQYLGWIVLAIPFMLLDAAGSASLRASGDTRTPMIIAVFTNVLNAAGNYVLIFGKFGAPEMGVSGAGLSTAISIAVQGTLVTAWLFGPWSVLRLRASSLGRVTRASAARLVRVTLPAVVEPVVGQTGFIIFIALMARLGENAVAAHRVAVAVESISFMPGWGLSIACGAIVGQCLGAQRPDRAAQALRQAATLACIVMGTLGVAIAIFTGPVVRFFVPDATQIWQPGIACLRIAAIEQPFMALAMVLGGALRGAGDTKSSAAVGMLGIWGVRLPLSYVFAFALGLGIVGAWIVMIIDWATRAAAFAWVWRRGRWKTIRL